MVTSLQNPIAKTKAWLWGAARRVGYLSLRSRTSITGSKQRVWAVGLIVLVPLLYFFYKQNYALLLTIMCLGTVLIISIRSKLMAILAVFAYLVLLGDIRRITTQIAGYRALDPLLLVGAGFAVYFALPLLLRVRLTDSLSKGMMALMAVMFLQIFNPKQGPISVGFSGALFAIVPVLWFWIGRRYASDRAIELLLYRVLLPLGAACAVLGLCQTYIGFFSWEEEWAKSFGSAYLLNNGSMRPFGFSSSAAEYGHLLLIASIIACAGILTKRRIDIIFLPLFGAAMVLAAMRGPIVTTVFGAAVMWAVRGKDARVWLPKLVFALSLGFALVFYSASSASDSAPSATPSANAAPKGSAAAAQSRVTEGLAHPFEAKHSTAGLHFQLFLAGIARGFTNPTGDGLGSTTLGSVKFGGVGYSSEVDISDAFMSLGFLGGLLYIFVIFETFRRFPAFLRSGPQSARLPVAGLLAALLGGWLAVGQYGTAPIVFFCLGAIAHSEIAEKNQEPVEVFETVQTSHLRFASGQPS